MARCGRTPGRSRSGVIDDHRPDVTEPPPAITREAKPVKVSITATDRDGDVLTIDVVEPPLHGILTDCADLPWDGQYGCTYHPEPGFVGRDRFVWSVSDGQAAPVRRTAGIDVREDQPPVAAPATWTTRIGRTVFALLAVDDADDGNQLAATLVGRPLHGTVRETSGLYWQYTPDPGFAGTDSFTFRASDGLLETLPTAITVIVTDNDRPTAESQVVRLPRGRLASFHLAGADPDHDPLGYRYIEVPAHGVMGWGNNSEPGIGIEMLYLAEAGFTGWDHLTYIANDGVLDSEPATIWIGVGDVGAAGPPSPTPGPTASDDGTGGSGSPRLTLPPTDTDIVVGDPPESGIAPWVTTVLLVGALAVASLTRRRRAALRDPMRR